MNVIVNFTDFMTFKGNTIAIIGLLWFLPIKVSQIPNPFQGLHDMNETSRTLQKVYDYNQNQITIYGYYTRVHSWLGTQKDCFAPKSLSKHYFE
jgi:hypothetical protein